MVGQSRSASPSTQTLDLDDLVDGFAQLVDRSFGDLRFVESGGEIDIRTSMPAVTAVRCELPRTEYLHLASVIIDADGLDDPVRQTTRTMSSVWKDYDQVLERGVIFDPANREKAFHTKKESYPWMEIGFDRPRDLSRIRVRNTEGNNSLRERGLQVQVRTDDGRLTTVYDGAERERQFVRAAEHYGNGIDGPEVIEGLRTRIGARLRPLGRSAVHPARPDLVKILTRLELQEYAPGRNALDGIDLTPAQISQFRALVNRRYLFPRELEWTSHGVRRSFRFWTERQQHEYLDFALEVISALRELTGDVCFGFGSVLAIVRDQKLIPHDDDLDVLIAFDPDRAGTMTDGRQLVRKCLQAKGFQVTGGMSAYQWVQPASGGPRLDVFIGVFEGDRISWYPGTRGGLLREQVFPAADREFLGRRCPVPGRPEEYLEQIYGAGWRQPDPNFQHTWNPAAYADIAGS
ncbi:MAG TPA: hypothetical protein VIP98_19250 [Microlunatus sp.]